MNRVSHTEDSKIEKNPKYRQVRYEYQGYSDAKIFEILYMIYAFIKFN